jgi:PAS domain S-box-containing protein
MLSFDNADLKSLLTSDRPDVAGNPYSRACPTWRRIIASEQAGEAEARLRRFDGTYCRFRFRANPLRDELGKIVKWYGTSIDIEDRKREEEALRAKEVSWRQIVENIPGLVVTMTARGGVEFLNRQILEYFGKTNEELKNWALIDVVHPDDLPRVIDAHTKAIETGQILDIEARFRRADGVYRWFQVRGLPVRDAAGTITAWYLLLTDIDDRKKAKTERVERASSDQCLREHAAHGTGARCGKNRRHRGAHRRLSGNAKTRRLARKAEDVAEAG